jgi:starch synthase
MPSRFEPCGLNQMYSQRYGTVPVVHRAGGLADTVVPVERAALEREEATGFVFTPATAQALAVTLRWALLCYRQPRIWDRLVQAGMARDFSWARSAEEYLALYERAIAARG